MNQFVCRSTAVAGIVALLALCSPASVLAEPRVLMVSGSSTEPAPPSLVPTVTRDQALVALKRHFPVPDGPGRVDAALSTQGSHLIWQVTFTGGHGADVTFGPPAVMAQVDAHTGQVRQFLRMGAGGRPIRTGPLPAPRTEAEARDRAWLMAKEMYPAEAATLRPAPRQAQSFLPWLDGDLVDDYAFSWVQYHGEVPVEGPAVTVTLDKYSLDYTAFRVSFPTLTFPTGDAKVTPAEALKLYRQALVPRLAYQPVEDSNPYPFGDQASAMKLIYRLERAGSVDAVSRRLVDASGQVLPPSPEAESVPAAAGPAVKPQQLPLTNDGAMALATELAALPAGAHFEMNSSGQLSGREDSLEFYWDGKGGGGSVVVNPTTGLILQANRYPQDLPNPDSGDAAAAPPVDAKQQAQARAAAIALVVRCCQT